MGSDLLKQQSGLDESWFLEIISMIEKEGLIKKEDSKYSLSSHKIDLNNRMKDLNNKIEEKIIQNGFIPITTKSISEKFNLAERECLELLHVLKNEEKIIKVDSNFWLHFEIKDKLYLFNKKHFESNDELNISDFKSYTGLTRKYAIPMLEFCDKQGWTSRKGDTRIKGQKL